MSETNKPSVRIDVWSDYVCPFCYLAEPTLARVEQEFAGRLEVIWRAFELRPDPVPTLDPKGEYLRDTWARAVYPMARERGMTLRLPPVQPRSRLAHEAVAFARAHGEAAALNHALFRAFFEYGEDIGDVNILAKHAVAVGLVEATLRRAIAEGAHHDEVLADEQLAQKLRLHGVPAIAVRAAEDPIELAVLLEGAQPYEVVRSVVEQVVAAR
ncbi:MAG: disulfide bond formation protein DsbA [Chthoniobacter sp.]|jgi:predicted DsbA family dithiol-disulfide isomerase|nr:disulfide bond formation protein DsbA [Chthoniobacter sp.]